MANDNNWINSYNGGNFYLYFKNFMLKGENTYKAIALDEEGLIIYDNDYETLFSNWDKLSENYIYNIEVENNILDLSQLNNILDKKDLKIIENGYYEFCKKYNKRIKKVVKMEDEEIKFLNKGE